MIQSMSFQRNGKPQNTFGKTNPSEWRLFICHGNAPFDHSLGSAIPPSVIAYVASFSGRSGLKLKEVKQFIQKHSADIFISSFNFYSTLPKGCFQFIVFLYWHAQEKYFAWPFTAKTVKTYEGKTCSNRISVRVKDSVMLNTQYYFCYCYYYY